MAILKEIAKSSLLSSTAIVSSVPAALAKALAASDVGDVSVAAVVGTFDPNAGVLSVFGDNLDNNVTVSRNAAGNILVNGGAVSTIGGTPTVANTSLIQMFGLGGNDVLTLNEANGALPRANMFGGAGNDVITGGSGADLLFGQGDNDTLLGKGGNDFLFGGAGNDVLTGGDADDQVFGEAGDDRMIWNPGDDSDLFEGGAGTDTAEVNGGNGAEVFTATANGTRVRFDRITPAPFSIDIGTTEKLVVNMNGGDDTFSATGNLAALISLTVDGGSGNDTILGGNGNDFLIGGTGNDFIDGNQGNDTALLGAGDDRFQWDPGDGSDVVEGQAGFDEMLFNGSAANEIFDVSANGERVRFTRNVANIVMDLNDVEHITVKALAGTDQIVVHDLSGTDTQQVSIDLAGVIGGTAGDGQFDDIRLEATNGFDHIEILGSGTSLAVVGTPAFVDISHLDATDRVTIAGRGGDDFISASSVVTPVQLVIDGGAGDDTLFGGAGADLFIGGQGNDFVDGNRGNDVAQLGDGNDVFVWDPGDGNDIIDGGAGTDELLFNGANVSESVTISALANGHAQFFRDVAAVTMDLVGVEAITFQALGGADKITVGDMTGTDVKSIELNLGINGAGDGQADAVSVLGGTAAETVTLTKIGNDISVQGFAAKTDILHAETIDLIVVDGGAGNDVINASAIAAGNAALTFRGGLGNDVFFGSQGNDLFFGGDGDDTAFMGAGDDTFVWNPGDDNDIVEGQGGEDTLLFNGANISETIDILANGGRALFLRNVANVTMDLNDTETISFKALGGADTINVHDLSGTDVKHVDIDLAGTIGGSVGDGQADTIVIDATNGDDAITITNVNGVIKVTGLGHDITITHFDANDRLVINGLGGSDVIDASGLNGILFAANGGDGDDVVIGSAGGDVLTGGNGDDVLLGNAGDDVLDGGAGDDVLLGGAGIDIVLGGPGDNVVLQDLIAKSGQFVV